MNNYSNWKVYIFGKWIAEGHKDIPPYGKPWGDLLKDPEFIEFRRKHEVTDKQISLIKKGFHNWDFPNYDDKPPEQIMPFGKYKDKPFSEIPQDYWLFLSKQTFLDKWPTVKLHVRNLLEKIKENGASQEEIKTILQKIS